MRGIKYSSRYEIDPSLYYIASDASKKGGTD